MKRGFTLIELLIVVAIIGILSTIAVPNMIEMWTRAKIGRAKSDLRTLAMALEMYHVERGKLSICVRPRWCGMADARLDSHRTIQMDQRD